MSDGEPTPNSAPYHRFEMEMNASVLNDPSSSPSPIHGQRESAKEARKRGSETLKWKVALAALAVVYVLTVASLLGYYFYDVRGFAQISALERETPKLGEQLSTCLDDGGVIDNCSRCDSNCGGKSEQLTAKSVKLRHAAQQLARQIQRIKSSAGIANFGHIVSKVRFGPGNSSYCVDSIEVGFGRQLYALPCDAALDAVNTTGPYWVMSVNGRLSHDVTCMAYGVFTSRGPPMMATFQCGSDLAATAHRQQWSYNPKSGQLRHIAAKTCLTLGDECYDENGERCELAMGACNGADERQWWTFAQ